MYIYSAAFSYYITQCGILIYITFLDLTHFSVYSDSVDCARYTQHGMEHTMDRGRACFTAWITRGTVISWSCRVDVMGSTHVSWIDPYISVC